MANNQKYSTIDEYISQFPQDVLSILQQIRLEIQQLDFKKSEKISYQIPTFYYHENVVSFAAYKNHIGFYPGPTAISYFKEAIKPYKHAKGSIQFSLKEPIPYALIREIVSYRIQEINEKLI